MPRHSAGLLTISKKADGVTWTKLRHNVGRHAAIAGRPLGRIGAKKLDPNDLVTIEELALSTMWETSALVELLERKGVLTKQDVLDVIRELRQREPTAIPSRAYTSPWAQPARP